MEKTYIEETIKIIRPTNKNHVFNEQDYDIVETSDKDGLKLVILRERLVQERENL